MIFLNIKKDCSVHNFMNFFSACSQVMFAVDIHFNANNYFLIFYSCFECAFVFFIGIALCMYVCIFSFLSTATSSKSL